MGKIRVQIKGIMKSLITYEKNKGKYIIKKTKKLSDICIIIKSTMF